MQPSIRPSAVNPNYVPIPPLRAILVEQQGLPAQSSMQQPSWQEKPPHISAASIQSQTYRKLNKSDPNYQENLNLYNAKLEEEVVAYNQAWTAYGQAYEESIAGALTPSAQQPPPPPLPPIRRGLTYGNFYQSAVETAVVLNPHNKSLPKKIIPTSRGDDLVPSAITVSNQSQTYREFNKLDPNYQEKLNLYNAKLEKKVVAYNQAWTAYGQAYGAFIAGALTPSAQQPPPPPLPPIRRGLTYGNLPHNSQQPFNPQEDQGPISNPNNGPPKGSFREICTIFGPLQLLPQYPTYHSTQYNSAGLSHSSYAGNPISLTHSSHDHNGPDMTPYLSHTKLPPTVFANPINEVLLQLMAPALEYSLQLMPIILPAVMTPQHMTGPSESRYTPPPPTLLATPIAQPPTPQHMTGPSESSYKTPLLPPTVLATLIAQPPTPENTMEHLASKSSHLLSSTLLSSFVSTFCNGIKDILGFTTFSKNIDRTQRGAEGEKEETASTRPISERLPKLIENFQAPPSTAPKVGGRFTNRLLPQERNIAPAA